MYARQLTISVSALAIAPDLAAACTHGEGGTQEETRRLVYLYVCVCVFGRVVSIKHKANWIKWAEFGALCNHLDWMEP